MTLSATPRSHKKKKTGFIPFTQLIADGKLSESTLNDYLIPSSNMQTNIENPPPPSPKQAKGSFVSPAKTARPSPLGPSNGAALSTPLSVKKEDRKARRRRTMLNEEKEELAITMLQGTEFSPRAVAEGIIRARRLSTSSAAAAGSTAASTATAPACFSDQATSTFVSEVAFGSVQTDSTGSVAEAGTGTVAVEVADAHTMAADESAEKLYAELVATTVSRAKELEANLETALKRALSAEAEAASLRSVLQRASHPAVGAYNAKPPHSQDLANRDYFFTAVLAIKMDLFQAGINPHKDFDAHELFDYVRQQKIPIAKWPSVITDALKNDIVTRGLKQFLL
jgi:hypothetical protein